MNESPLQYDDRVFSNSYSKDKKSLVNESVQCGISIKWGVSNKKNEELIHATWMNLENPVLSKRE